MTRVWVTRDEGEDGRHSHALRAAGLKPVVEPVLTTVHLSDAGEKIQHLGPDDWLVLTSPRAIESVAIEPARVPRVAVVGEPSRRAAEARGMRVELVSPTGDGPGLWAVLKPLASGRRVCFPRSALARVPEVTGFELTAPVIYRPEPRAWDTDVLSRIDITSLASASAVAAIHDRLGRLPTPMASIGHRTTAAIRQRGGEPDIEAAEPSFQSLAEAIARWRFGP